MSGTTATQEEYLGREKQRITAMVNAEYNAASANNEHWANAGGTSRVEAMTMIANCLVPKTWEWDVQTAVGSNHAVFVLVRYNPKG